MIIAPPKAPAEVLDYALDFADALVGGDSIASKSVTVTGATKDEDTFSGSIVTVWVSGGTAGTIIRVTAVVVTNGGRTLQRTLVIPFGEPVSLEQAKAQCRVELDDSDEDELIAGYISTARETVETDTGLTLVRRQLVEHHEAFVQRLGTPFGDDYDRCGSGRSWPPVSRRAPLWLRAWPIVSVDSVAYTDTDGAAQTLADTRAILGTWPAKLHPARDTDWPDISEAEGVDVTLTGGYAEGDVPLRAVQAMLLLIAHWYRNRETVVAGDRAAAIEVPQAYAELCDKLRNMRV